MSQQPLEVVALVLENARQQILLAQRPVDKHQGGLWEFPGGKVEPGESLVAALQREIEEELHYTLINPEPLIKITHSYPDLTVKLNIFYQQDNNPQVTAVEQQPLNWVAKDDLYNQSMPAADKAILDAIVLPRVLHTIRIHTIQDLTTIKTTESLILQFDHLPRGEQEQFLQEFTHHPFRKYCSVQADHTLLQHYSQYNRHYTSSQKIPTRDDHTGWISTQCSDIEDVHLALQKQCDYIIFSNTEKHFDWDTYQSITEISSIPIYADHINLTQTDSIRCRRFFGQGIITNII